MFKRLAAAYQEAQRSIEYMRAIDDALVGGHFTLLDYLEIPLSNALRAYLK